MRFAFAPYVRRAGTNGPECSNFAASLTWVLPASAIMERRIRVTSMSRLLSPSLVFIAAHLAFIGASIALAILN